MHQLLGRSRAAHYPPHVSCKERSEQISSLCPTQGRKAPLLQCGRGQCFSLHCRRTGRVGVPPTLSHKANAFLNHFSIMKLPTQAEHTRAFRWSQNFFLRLVAAEWRHKLTRKLAGSSVVLGKPLPQSIPTRALQTLWKSLPVVFPNDDMKLGYNTTATTSTY